MKSDERNEQEPARLLDRSGSNAPVDLVRALRALRSERPSAALMERVSDRLLQAAELSPSASTTAASSVQAGLAYKWIAGILAVTVAGSTAAWMWSRSTSAPQTATALPSAARASVEPEVPSSPVVEAAGPATASAERTQPTAASESRAATTASRRRNTVGARGREVSDDRSARGSRKVADSSSMRAPSDADLTASSRRESVPSAGERSDLATSVPPEQVEQALPAPAPREQPPKQREQDELARSAKPTMGEAQLLVRARALASHDPNQAFALLSEHERRYPEGLLAVEREVLAIEVLRLLQRTHEASKRLSAFRARYPDSPHVRRLTRP